MPKSVIRVIEIFLHFNISVHVFSCTIPVSIFLQPFARLIRVLSLPNWGIIIEGKLLNIIAFCIVYGCFPMEVFLHIHIQLEILFKNEYIFQCLCSFGAQLVCIPNSFHFKPDFKSTALIRFEGEDVKWLLGNLCPNVPPLPLGGVELDSSFKMMWGSKLLLSIFPLPHLLSLLVKFPFLFPQSSWSPPAQLRGKKVRQGLEVAEGCFGQSVL